MYVKGYCVIERVIPNVNCYSELKNVVEGDVVEYIIDTDISNVKRIPCLVSVRRFDCERGVTVCKIKMHFEQFCARFVEQRVYDVMGRVNKSHVNFIVSSVDNLM